MTIRVCCECKKRMGQVEDGRSETVESHGICRPCMRENHPEVYEDMAMKRGGKGTNISFRLSDLVKYGVKPVIR